MPVFYVNKTNGIEGIWGYYKSALSSTNPALVAGMGATAAQSVFGKITPINKNRGRPIDLADGIRALVACPGCCAAHPGPRSARPEHRLRDALADPGPIVSHGSRLCGAPPKRRCTASGTR